MSAAPADSEWQVGWRIVLACAVANGTGIALLFYCFSLFLIPMSTDLGLTRTDTGIVQSLIITAVLGAPVIGRLTDPDNPCYNALEAKDWMIING